MDGFVFPLCIGIGLSAACGFRVFVPLLVMSLAAHGDEPSIQLASGFEWIGSMPAMIAFGTATALEIAGYYIPWGDNLLDSIATPAAIMVGSVATASMVGDVSPFLQWSIGIIAGGGIAGTVQAVTVVARATSTATTGGLGNPLVSTAEAGTSVGLSLLALVIAPLVVLLVLVALFWFGRKLFRRRRAKAV